VLSSPGSGKTEFLCRTLADLAPHRAAVIVGDLATDNDARRLRQTGVPAVQVTTGTVCHLEPEMVAHAADSLDLAGVDLLIVENVGNLICPAAYELGEDLRIVLLSVTEGEDKPLKYPVAFEGADVVVLSKMDLANAVGLDRAAAHRNIRRAAPRAVVFDLSARSGEGMSAWLDYLRDRLRSPAERLQESPNQP
jgi:hydrogenase nickel incorporation protein HypB